MLSLSFKLFSAAQLYVVYPRVPFMHKPKQCRPLMKIGLRKGLR